jgi:ATP-dependent helicase/nuclease subunit A
MSNKPTKEQLAVIYEKQGHFSVLASAGSGKTYVVTERYLRIVEEKLASPSQILAITFTRKAAAEMKRRIVDRLRGRDLLDEAQEAETGPIQTIHSFCERILRENAIACGLDPKFEIVSSGEGSRLRRLAIQKAITLAEIEDEDVAFFLQSLVGQRDGTKSSSYSEIEKVVERLMDKLRSSDHTQTHFDSLFSSATEYIQNTHQELLKTLPTVVQVEVASGFGAWDVIARDVLKQNRQLSRFPWLKTPISKEAEARGARLVCGLARLALSAWSLYEASLRERQVLDFNQLERKAVAMLEDNPSVRRRIQLQYRYVMVDEAQDLNPIQFRIFGAVEASSKVLIGDDKQSIYLFRQADVEKFRSYSKSNARLLSENFRSEKSIQRFVDDVFGNVFGELYAPMQPLRLDTPTPYDAVEVWKLTAAKHWRELAQLLIQNPMNGSTAILVRENKTISDIESALRQVGIGTRTMGGKSDFYANLEIRDLANLLNALIDPSDEYALLATLRSPVVGVTLDTTILLSASEGGVRSNLYSFVAPYPEDQRKLEAFTKWFSPLSLTADRYTAWEVISKVLAESQLLPNLAKRLDSHRKILNVRKLLVIATQTPSASVREFAEMLGEIRSLNHQEGDAPLDDDRDDLIVIGTVHRAKGLEWDNVIVADGMTYSVKAKSEPAIDSHSGWVGYKHKSSLSYVAQYLQEKQKQGELEELKRLEYVALTRAKKRLVLVSWLEGNKNLLNVVRTGIGSEQFDALRTTSSNSKE